MSLKALPSKERERILRQNWWGHDGRWFYHVASEFGFSKANQMNMAINRAVGKMEMRNFLTAGGLSGIEIQKNILDILKANMEMCAADVFSIRHFTQEGDAFTLVIDECSAHTGTVKAGYAGNYECACFKRCEGWLDGLGIRGNALINASLLKGDDHCKISINLEK
jgi:hypothetical protein